MTWRRWARMTWWSTSSTRSCTTQNMLWILLNKAEASQTLATLQLEELADDQDDLRHEDDPRRDERRERDDSDDENHSRLTPFSAVSELRMILRFRTVCGSFFISSTSRRVGTVDRSSSSKNGFEGSNSLDSSIVAFLTRITLFCCGIHTLKIFVESYPPGNQLELLEPFSRFWVSYWSWCTLLSRL